MDILVPTDFSACAEYALEAAVKLSEKYKAVVHVIHALEPNGSSKFDYLDQKMVREELNKEKENAKTLIASLCEKHNGPEYKIHTKAGRVHEVVEEYAQRIEAELIVVGSHGASPGSNLYMGSNAQKMVRNIRRKIMVIKNPFTIDSMSEVVFASGFNVSEHPAMLEFRDFIQPFAKKVHLVYIQTDLFFGLPKTVIDEVMEEAKSLFSPLAVETHYFKDYTIEQGIERISKQLNAGLIGISNISKHPLKRIFSGSNVEALVNHSHLPVLSIDFQPIQD